MAPSVPNRSEFLRLLLRRIRRDLAQAYQRAARLADPAASVAASWLLGNRSSLQSQLRECGEALSRATCRRLARAEGPSEFSAPRIYRILEQALSRSGGRLTAADLSTALTEIAGDVDAGQVLRNVAQQN